MAKSQSPKPNLSESRTSLFHCVFYETLQVVGKREAELLVTRAQLSLSWTLLPSSQQSRPFVWGLNHQLIAQLTSCGVFSFICKMGLIMAGVLWERLINVWTSSLWFLGWKVQQQCQGLFRDLCYTVPNLVFLVLPSWQVPWRLLTQEIFTRAGDTPISSLSSDGRGNGSWWLCKDLWPNSIF